MTTMTFCHGLYELMDSYDGFIIDQSGVLHDGVSPYDGVVDALNHLRQRKKQVVVLSNSARRSDENVERLKRLGIKQTLFKAVVTAGEVTWQGLREQKEPPFKGLGKKCYLVGRPNDRDLFAGLDIELVDKIEDAEFMIISGLDTRKFPKLEDLDPVFKKAVIKHIPALCSNPDLITVFGNERGIGPGAIAKRYHELGGMAHLVGKPHKTIFRYCLHLFEGVIPSRVLVIGDSLQHDIAGGMGVDLDTCFVASGIHVNTIKPGMTEEQKRKVMEHLCQGYGGIRPTWVLDTLVWQTPEAALRERERARMKE
jgi:HAD superfamily hydrolase (TIGR01459 family)